MRSFSRFLPTLLLCTAAAAQTTAIFPDEYVDVAEGPFNSPNRPLAEGTARVQILYEAVDLDIPSGDQITRLGFREDGNITTMDTGRTLQLEIRMGWSTLGHTSMTNNFDNNYESPPVTVFGPALLTLPNLRDTSNPLPDGKVWIDLTTPFSYVPAGRNLVVEYRCFGNSGGGSSFNYRLDRADYYSPVTYGPAGCAHSGGGVPNLTVQPTRPGLNYSCSMTSGPANAPGVLLVQPNLSLLPPVPLDGILGLAPSCTAQVWPVDAILLSTVSSGSGSANWNVFLANDPINADIVISSQALFLDFFAPGQLVVSNGGEVLTGARPRTAILSGNGLPTSVTTGSVSQFYCPVAFFAHQ